MMGFPDIGGAKESRFKWLLLVLYLGGTAGFFFWCQSLYDWKFALEFMDASVPSFGPVVGVPLMSGGLK